jgi:hypothetical protein
MNKFLVSMVALFATTSAFAAELPSINLNNVQKAVVNKSQGPAFSAQSFAGVPVVNNKGQFVGFDLAVLVDKHDENVAVLRPLGSYKVAGVTFDSVYATSFSRDGKKVYGGLGLMAKVGKLVPGIDAKLGVIAPGAEITNGFKISNEFVPAVEVKVDAVTAMRNLVSAPTNVEKTVRSFFKQVF